MSDATTVVTGPARVLALGLLAANDSCGKYDLQQVVFGVDERGAWAAATDTRVMGFLRWNTGVEKLPPCPPVGVSSLAVHYLWSTTARDVNKLFRVEEHPFGNTIGLSKEGFAIPCEKPGKFPLEKIPAFGQLVDEARSASLPPTVLAPDVLRKVADFAAVLNSSEGYDTAIIGTLPNVSKGIWSFRFGTVETQYDAPGKLHGWMVAMPLAHEMKEGGT